MFRVLLLWLTPAGFAQVGPASAPSAPPAAAVASYTAVDSLDAVQAMFMMKRSGAKLPLVLALPGLRLMASGRREYNVYTGSWEETPAPTGAVVGGLALTGIGAAAMLITNSNYSLDKLAMMRVGNTIPAEYRAKLRPRHFAKAAKWRAKLARKAARRNS